MDPRISALANLSQGDVAKLTALRDGPTGRNAQPVGTAIGKKVSITAKGSKRLGGKRGELHQAYRAEGLSWRPVGVVVVTNNTGADALVYASSGTGTATSGGVRISNPIMSARLVIQNDGGSCNRISNIQPDGQVLYTGAAPIPSAHALVGKNTGVVDPLDKDAGIPVGKVAASFDMQLWLENGDTAVVSLNGYTSCNIADVDNDDDGSADEGA